MHLETSKQILLEVIAFLKLCPQHLGWKRASFVTWHRVRRLADTVNQELS